MIKGITITKKYCIYLILMLVLFLAELFMPYENRSLNLVFFGIAFFRIVMTRYMEHLYADEVRRGNDYRKHKNVLTAMTYYYLAVFIFDIQASLGFAVSEENIMTTYRFFVLVWTFQFVLGAVLTYFNTNNELVVKVGWIGINVALVIIMFIFFGVSYEWAGTYEMRNPVIIALFLIRGIMWCAITLERIGLEKKQ